MKKANIKIKINDYIIENQGIIDKEILKVQDKDENIEFDTKNLILTKENTELKITMDFNKETVIYDLIKEKGHFNNKLTTLSLTNSDKQVIIIYRIEDADYNLQINYETI